MTVILIYTDKEEDDDVIPNRMIKIIQKERTYEHKKVIKTQEKENNISHFVR